MDDMYRCHEVKWIPSHDHLDSPTFRNLATSTLARDPGYGRWLYQVETAAVLKVTDALDDLEDLGSLDFEGHKSRFLSWALHLRDELLENRVQWISLREWQRYRRNSALKAALYKDVEVAGASGELAMRMGSNIVPWLRNETDPLELLFGQDDILQRFYTERTNAGDIPAIQKEYLRILKDNVTDLTVLEVGAGTGGSTGRILHALSGASSQASGNHRTVGRYMFTDVSSGFFDKARERFQEHLGIMEFRTLNAEEGVLRQGFSPQSCDIIVAANVLHATSDLEKTLCNIRQLLKPDGKLLLHETIRQDVITLGVAFGQLKGWWYGTEAYRQWSPNVDAGRWDLLLKASGFSGVDINVQDNEDPALHVQSLLISSAKSPVIDQIKTGGTKALANAVQT